jgi:hypothetical protein
VRRRLPRRLRCATLAAIADTTPRPWRSRSTPSGSS